MSKREYIISKGPRERGVCLRWVMDWRVSGNQDKTRVEKDARPEANTDNRILANLKCNLHLPPHSTACQCHTLLTRSI